MIKRIPFHVVILTFYPVTALYLSSRSISPFEETIRSFIFVPLFAALFWLVTYAIIRDTLKTSVITSFFLLLFFTHKHTLLVIAIVLTQVGSLQDVPLFHNDLLSPIWFGLWFSLFLVLAYYIARSRSRFPTISSFLNVISLALAVIVLGNWLYGTVLADSAEAKVDYQQIGACSDWPADDGQAAYLPDIYYIILDGYARSDILTEIYQLDNSEFLADLTEKGFYIADQSRSNYIQTVLSLASSLNTTYLDGVVDQIGTDSKDRRPLAEMIENSAVAEQLRKRGYTIVSFATGFSITEVRSADLYLAPKWDLNEFENVLIGTTPIPLFLELPFLKTQHDIHRDRILYALDQLPDVAQIDAPTFVFAHIVAPHPPFVLGANGDALLPGGRWSVLGSYSLDDGSDFVSPGNDNAYVEGYQQQLLYITQRLEEVTGEILARSSEPPIIILQADHGPGSKLDWHSLENTYVPERVSILNAYFFPDRNYEDLYPDITPVNTFRVIADRYFGADCELLDDRSFFATTADPYVFTDVTQETTPDSSK